ncbi:MAG: o-succinylbenzoate--CoA ligase [Alicyclobacillaceae bacterium]|nr:o-succinylbenzoate--CoA ligase [Alicyclobacillaceae bacterium]
MWDAVPDWLSRRADTHPDHDALCLQGRRVTYRELHRSASALAQRLQAVGVRAGERVALLARDGGLFAVAVHALMQLRAVLLPLNVRLAPPEMGFQLADAGVRLLLHDEHTREAASLAAQAVRDLAGGGEGGERVELWELTDAVWRNRASGPVAAADENLVRLADPLAVMYTSGTTGVPKGAVLTYGNFWWSALTSAVQLGLDPSDRWLVPMPLFHVGGLSVLIRSVIYGTTAVVHDSFDADAVNSAIDSDGITLVSVVPTMLDRMLDRRGGRPYPAHLRCVLLGGAAASRHLLERCQALGVPVAQSYGLTEATSQVATLQPRDGLRKLGSSGKPLPATEVRIVRADGSPAGVGEPGEIVVRGPTVTPGYWRRPEETRNAIRNGWLHTGDIGCLDAEGYLYVLDRRRDLIVSGGENVYPAEVESVLCAHPSVEEAGVVAMDDPVWGQVPAAFVVLRPGGRADEQELRAFCRDRLAGYKVPKRFLFVERLPRNASGKLLRRKLSEWLHTQPITGSPST